MVNLNIPDRLTARIVEGRDDLEIAVNPGRGVRDRESNPGP